VGFVGGRWFSCTVDFVTCSASLHSSLTGGCCRSHVWRLSTRSDPDRFFVGTRAFARVHASRYRTPCATATGLPCVIILAVVTRWRHFGWISLHRSVGLPSPLAPYLDPGIRFLGFMRDTCINNTATPVRPSASSRVSVGVGVVRPPGPDRSHVCWPFSGRGCPAACFSFGWDFQSLVK
jgi:hypothetical protein